MKQRKIPLRTCVVTKEQFPKQELLRIVRDKEGNVTVDETGRANGRGAYIKKDLEVLDKAKKTKIFIVFQYLIIIFAENITNINNQQKPELLAQLL